MKSKAVSVQIVVIENNEDLPLPAYKSAEAAGMDLYAAVTEEVVLGPSKRCLIPCGIRIELPEGYEAQVRSRSGLAVDHGIHVLNSPGTIDSDYREPIFVILKNSGDQEFIVKRRCRIAQLVVAPVTKIEWMKVESLSETARGKRRRVSTGTKEPESRV